MSTYHRDLGFPTWFTPPTGKMRLRYTRHAAQAALTDRYGAIALPTELDTASAQLIEATFERGALVKAVYRLIGHQLDSRKRSADLVLVVLMGADRGLVKTVWLNLTADKHKTLRAENYARP